MSYYTNKQPGSSENITISTEATIITTPPPQFLKKCFLDITLQEMFYRSDEISNRSDQRFEEKKEVHENQQ